MVPGLETENDCVRPAVRSGPLAPAVNCAKPSPEVMRCCVMAPASLQPSQPLVLVTELPLAVALTTLIHVALCAVPPLEDVDGAGVGAGVGAVAGAGVGAGAGAAGAGLEPAAMAAAIPLKSTPTSLPSVPARTYGVPAAST